MTLKRLVGFELLDSIVCLDCGSDPDLQDEIRDAEPIRAGSSLARERCTECGQTLWETAYPDCGADTLEEATF